MVASYRHDLDVGHRRYHDFARLDDDTVALVSVIPLVCAGRGDRKMGAVGIPSDDKSLRRSIFGILNRRRTFVLL